MALTLLEREVLELVEALEVSHHQMKGERFTALEERGLILVRRTPEGWPVSTTLSAEGVQALREAQDSPERRYDVRAAVYALEGGGSDGAYDLICDGATAEEICANLLEVLKAEWGMSAYQGDRMIPCRLEISIGPAGTGDTHLTE